MSKNQKKSTKSFTIRKDCLFFFFFYIENRSKQFEIIEESETGEGGSRFEDSLKHSKEGQNLKKKYDSYAGRRMRYTLAKKVKSTIVRCFHRSEK